MVSATRSRAKGWRLPSFAEHFGLRSKEKQGIRLKREVIPLRWYLKFLRNNNLRENRRHRKLVLQLWRKRSKIHRSQITERTLCGCVPRDHCTNIARKIAHDNGAHETRRSDIKQINPSAVLLADATITFGSRLPGIVWIKRQQVYI